MARESINKNNEIGQEDSWAYFSLDGSKYLSSTEGSKYGSPWPSSCSLTATVNISEGWLEFFLEDQSQGRIESLPLCDAPLFWAVSTGYPSSFTIKD